MGSGPFLRIAGQEILGVDLEDGNLQTSLRLYSPTDDLLLHINQNEWISGDTLPWDIEADWQTLTLRERARQISVSINTKTIPMQVKGVFYKSGKRVILSRTGIRWGETAMGGMSDFAAVSILLEIEADKEGCRFGPHKTHSHAIIISHQNHRERLRLAKDAWRKTYSKVGLPSVAPLPYRLARSIFTIAEGAVRRPSRMKTQAYNAVVSPLCRARAYPRPTAFP